MQTPGDNKRQGRLVCCSPWGHRVGKDLATEQQDESGEAAQGKRLGDLDYKCGQPLIPGMTPFKRFGLSFLILKLTSKIFKTLIL